MTEKIITKKVLKWYDLNKRNLPWRKKVPSYKKHYYTLVSEFMLQQTQVVTVIPFFNRFITDQVGIRNLSEAVIVDGTGQIIAKSRFAFSIIFSELDSDWLDRARNDEVVITRTDDNTKIQALVKLNNFVDAYLLVGRFIDSDVLEAVDKTRLAVSDYQSLSIRQFDLQISMAAIFAVISLFLLLSALWIGLSLSSAITKPLRGIILVADSVRAGDLNSRVDIKTDWSWA